MAIFAYLLIKNHLNTVTFEMHPEHKFVQERFPHRKKCAPIFSPSLALFSGKLKCPSGNFSFFSTFVKFRLEEENKTLQMKKKHLPI